MYEVKVIVLHDGVTVMGEIEEQDCRIGAVNLMAVNFIPVKDEKSNRQKTSISFTIYPPLAEMGTFIPISPRICTFGPYKPEDRFIKVYNQTVAKIKQESSGIQVVSSISNNIN